MCPILKNMAKSDVASVDGGPDRHRFCGRLHAGTYVWEDFTVPFKQTIRFSTAETAIVRVTIPAGVTTASDRVPIICRIEQNSPWLRPYMIVNNNRAAFYYLGENGVVSIRSEHLKAGPNEFLFGDQTTTGDLIFIYELRFHSP